jgi:uncharacterized delta-60 repeat protein
MRATRPSRSVRLAVQPLEARETPSTGGLLDPTFGSGGVVSPASSGDFLCDVLAQPDGKVVTVGRSNGDFLIARYNPNGFADTTFGTGGRVTTNIGKPSSPDFARAVAIQPGTGGKLIAAGATSDYHTSNSDLALARYSPNGTLDTTFGTKGKVITDLGTGSDHGWSMAVQPDGRIVVAGSYGSGQLAVIRYTAAGALDSTFGSGGKVLTNIALGNGAYGGGRRVDVALQSDGRIVVCGSVDDFIVVRLNSNGSFDTTFGNGTGRVTTQFPDRPQAGASAVAIQADGRIVVAGDSNVLGGGDDCVTVVRYNPDGSLDPAFGSGGTDVVHLNLADPTVNQTGAATVAVQSDGRIVLGGYARNDAYLTQYYDLATRLNPDGTVDTGYGTNGAVVVPISGDVTYAGAIQSDGKAVFVTQMGDVFRLLPSAPQVGSFTANPNPAPAGSTVTLSAEGLTDGNAGATVTQVAFYADTNGDGVLDSGDTLLGYGTNTSGTWALNWSTAGYAVGMYTLFAQATDSLGAIGEPLGLSLQLV